MGRTQRFDIQMKKILLALAIVGMVAGNVTAATYYWDTDTTSAGNDATTGAGLGGVGNWDAATSNWWDGVASSALLPWPDASPPNDAVFTGTGAAVTIPASVIRNTTGVAFKASGYDVTAGGSSATRGTLNFTNAASLVADPGISGTITAKLTGTNGYNVSGGGTIRFAEPQNLNSTTGPVTITGGSTLELGVSGEIGGTGVNSGNITIDNGTLRNTNNVTGQTNTTFLTANRNIFIGTGGATFDASTTALLYAGIVSGGATSPLTKAGNGEVRFNGGPLQINTYEKTYITGSSTSQLTIGQSIILGDDRNLGAVPASFMQDNITIDSGASFRFNGAGGPNGDTITLHPNRGITIGAGGATITALANGVIPGKITDGGGGFGLNKASGSIVTLTSNLNDYSGATNINGGTLRVNNTSGSGTGSGLVLVNNTGALGGTGSVSGAVLVSSGGRIAPGAGGGNSVLTIPNATFGSGTFLDSTLGAAGNSDVLKITQPSTGAGTGLDLQGGTHNITAISNPAGQTYTLIDYTGGYTNGAPLIINDLTGFDDTVVSDDPGNHRFKIVVGSTPTVRTWATDGDGNWSNDNATNGFNWTTGSQANGIGSTANFGITTPNSTTPKNVTISDYSKVVGTLNLDNASASYVIKAGVTGLRLITNTYSGSALIDVKNGSHTISAPITLTAPTEIKVSSGNTLFTTSGTATGSLTKTGLGTMNFASTWAGTGAVNINEGTLQYNTNASGLSDNATVTIAAGAFLDFHGDVTTTGINDTIGDLAGDGNIINAVPTTGGTGITLAGFNSTTFSGDIQGSSRLNISKYQGSLNLTRPTGLSYTGNTLIQSGTLFVNNTSGSATGTGTVTVSNVPFGGGVGLPGGVLGGNGSIAGALTVNNGGVVAPGNSIGTLTAAGNVTLNSGAILRMELDTDLGVDKSDTLVVGGTLALGATAGNRTINLTNAGGMTGGIYTLIDYTTAFTGLFSNLVLGTQPAGFTYKLFDNTASTSIDVSVINLAGDYDNNGIVDAADWVIWREAASLGQVSLFPNDPNIGTVVDDDQYVTWRSNFGNTSPGSAGGASLTSAVPEPGSLILALVGLMAVGAVRKR